MPYVYNPQTGMEEWVEEGAYIDGSGNIVSPEEAQRRAAENVGDTTPPDAGTAPPVGSAPGGDLDRKRGELRGAGYPGPWDDASVEAAYARTVGGGNAGAPTGTKPPGAPPGSAIGPGGYPVIGGYDWYSQMAVIAQAQAQLEYQKERMLKVEIRTIDDARQFKQWQKDYDDKKLALDEAYRRAQRAQQSDQFHMTRGDTSQQYAVGQQMRTWEGQQALAAQNAQRTGFYKPPSENPTLPGHYLLDEYSRTFRAMNGRDPTQAEKEAEFLRNPQARGADPNARPWSYLDQYNAVDQSNPQGARWPRPAPATQAQQPGQPGQPNPQPGQPSATAKPTRTGDKQTDFQTWGAWLEKLRKEHPDWDGYKAIEETDKDLGWDRAGNDYKAKPPDLGSEAVQRSYMGLTAVRDEDPTKRWQQAMASGRR